MDSVVFIYKTIIVMKPNWTIRSWNTVQHIVLVLRSNANYKQSVAYKPDFHCATKYATNMHLRIDTMVKNCH